MKIKPASEEYLEKAQKLTEEESERLLSRMRGKPARKLEDNKLTTLEALAMDFPQYRRHFSMSDLLLFKLNGA